MAQNSPLGDASDASKVKQFRYGLIAGVLALTGLVGVLWFRSAPSRGSDGSDAERAVTAYLDFSPVVSFIGFYVAEEQQLFKEVGLQVTFEHGQGANDAAAVVASGRYPLGTSSGQATVLTRGRGGDIVSLAVLYPTVPTVAVSVPTNAIRTPSDLVGKRVGINQSSATYNDYQWVLAKRSVQRTSLEETPIGFDYTPFLTGQVDVFFNYSDQMPALISRMPVAPVEVPLVDWGLQGYGFNVVGNGAFCASNQSVCHGFAQAVARGYQWARENPDAAATLFSRRFRENDPALVRNGLGRVLAALGPGVVGAQSISGWDTTITTARDSGLEISTSVTPESVMPRAVN